MAVKIEVTIERGKDGFCSALTDYTLPGYGLMGFGDSAEEAIRDFKEAYAEACEMIAEEGEPMPDLDINVVVIAEV